MTRAELDLALPGAIPADERVIWHGRPDWVGLARRAFRIEWVTLYFALLALWVAAAPVFEGAWDAVPLTLAKTAGLAALAAAVLGALAWLSARTTLYVVTSRRVVMRVGIALPVFLNLPFTRVGAAAARTFADGTGDISLHLSGDDRIAYLTLWPHARPGRFTRPEPTLRAIPQCALVAEGLSRALIGAQGGGVATPVRSAPKREPARPAFGAPALNH